MRGTSAEVRRAIGSQLLRNYFDTMVNHFFKILPMRENEEESLPTYMCSLQIELVGCGDLVSRLRTDPSFMTLLSILQYLIEHPDCDVANVKREVFHAISICRKLREMYESEVSE